MYPRQLVDFCQRLRQNLYITTGKYLGYREFMFPDGCRHIRQYYLACPEAFGAFGARQNLIGIWIQIQPVTHINHNSYRTVLDCFHYPGANIPWHGPFPDIAGIAHIGNCGSAGRNQQRRRTDFFRKYSCLSHNAPGTDDYFCAFFPRIGNRFHSRWQNIHAAGQYRTIQIQCNQTIHLCIPLSSDSFALLQHQL